MLPHPAHAKWIRKGKKFPDDMLNLPTDLHDLYDSVLGVPTTIRTFLLPSVDISVIELLRFPLPRVFQGSITASDPASFFGDAIPDDNLAHVKTQNVPPKEFVKDVRKAVGQALLDGKHSVCHPIERHAPLPLWMITFWEELHVALEIKASWEHAYNWVQKNIGTNPSFGQVDKQLAILPWNKPLVGPAASGTHTTIVLARFLSDESWMPGVLMDMMTACLSDPKCGTIIADTGFMNAIVTAQSISYFDEKHRGLKEINERLRVLSILYAPVYLPDPGHWIALSINRMTRSFCYGELT
ncbi:hypothetical protein M405DRAFT_125611 [Rhizopogon salebrosus TDB-379]|nr:hypothetical protein M405DRAFT_125611 [Rhizopogon salebrosus TDB-379]